MKTIIMTVGTSLLTNRDPDLTNKRPWLGQKTVGDRQQALIWMGQTELTLISAETNTLWRLDPSENDEIILLHSDTSSGLECAQVLQKFFKEKLGQTQVALHALPGINYEVENEESALVQMAHLLTNLIHQAMGDVTLAATGGFKAQTMIMGLVGNHLGVPVCYIHEEFKGLVFIPYLSASGQTENRVRSANLPNSGVPRSEIIKVRSDQQEPNRPRLWSRVTKMLMNISWIDSVYYDERAYTAPENGVKSSRQKTEDGRYILWLRLVEKDKKMAVAIETTGRTPEQLEQSVDELTQRLGQLV
ncbi:MAG: putative CRISPR-associated protein [Cyanobacteriota bacterium]|jgi:putative CRISPR-associated protein (TIGR02619 family)